MDRRHGEWVLGREDRSVPRARALARDTLHGLSGEMMDAVLLLTTELVSNAVRHGAGAVQLHVTWDHQGVHVEVGDGSRDLPVVQPSDPGAPDGRGLLLVEGLSDSWGVLADDTGKTVWFTLTGG